MRRSIVLRLVLTGVLLFGLAQTALADGVVPIVPPPGGKVAPPAQ